MSKPFLTIRKPTVDNQLQETLYVIVPHACGFNHFLTDFGNSGSITYSQLLIDDKAVIHADTGASSEADLIDLVKDSDDGFLFLLFFIIISTLE